MVSPARSAVHAAGGPGAGTWRACSDLAPDLESPVDYGQCSEGAGGAASILSSCPLRLDDTTTSARRTDRVICQTVASTKLMPITSSCHAVAPPADENGRVVRRPVYGRSVVRSEWTRCREPADNLDSAAPRPTIPSPGSPPRPTTASSSQNGPNVTENALTNSHRNSTCNQCLETCPSREGACRKGRDSSRPVDHATPSCLASACRSGLGPSSASPGSSSRSPGPSPSRQPYGHPCAAPRPRRPGRSG